MAEANLRAVTHEYTVVLGLVQCGGNVDPLADQRRGHRAEVAERLSADSSTARRRVRTGR